MARRVSRRTPICSFATSTRARSADHSRLREGSTSQWDLLHDILGPDTSRSVVSSGRPPSIPSSQGTVTSPGDRTLTGTLVNASDNTLSNPGSETRSESRISGVGSIGTRYLTNAYVLGSCFIISVMCLVRSSVYKSNRENWLLPLLAMRICSKH